MKSLICSIALLLSAFVLQAQTTYPIRQNIGAATTLVKTPDYGGLQAGIIPYSFADTTAANTALTYLKNYCGATIYTTDFAAKWYRSCYGGGYRWVMIDPSGIPGTGNAWRLYGNGGLFTSASGDVPLGITVPNYGIDFTTNNTSRVILDRTGLSLLSSISDTTDNKVMTYNTSTRKWNYGYWFGSGGGGGTPLSSITAATATNDINSANYQQEWRWDALTATGMKFTTRSTASAANSTFISMERSGTHATANRSTYVLNVSNKSQGTNTLNNGILVNIDSNSNTTSGGKGVWSITGANSNKSTAIYGIANGDGGNGVVADFAGQFSGTGLYAITQSGAMDLSSAPIFQRATKSIAYSSRDIGAYDLTNVGVYAAALNGQNNYAIIVPPDSGHVGIGISSPNTSSLMDISSTTKGLLIPRMTEAQKNAISTPATGLLIFQTNGTSGFYYYNGAAWVTIYATPTWQQTLTAGSTLTGTNIADASGGTFIISNALVQQYGTTGVGSYLNLAQNNGTGDVTNNIILRDSIIIQPSTGKFYIDTLANNSSQNTLMGWVETTGASTQGQVGYITVGSGLSISAGVLNTSGTVPTTWNSITSPTGDQALTFQAGESSTWTDQNTTEDLLTINNATQTTASMLSLNRTSTALASGNNIGEFISSGVNGTNAITATGLNVSVTNTNVTSGTNVGLSVTASGATTANYSILAPSGFMGLYNSAPAAKFQLNHDANSVTQSDANGILLANATAATAGLQSISPPIILQGNGWKTNATAASQDVRFRMQVLPVQAAANPTSILQIQSSINGGAYTTPYEFASGGGFTATGTILSTSGNIQSSAGFVSASNVVNAGTQFVNQSTTALTYRTTNGGSNVTPAGFFGAPITNTAGTQAFAFDVTNGQSFTAANGTRHIARAGLNIVNLVNTAASESADLAFYTQAAGAAMAERLRITSTAFTVPTDNIYDLGSSTASLKDIYSRTLKLDGSTSGTATITPPAVAASPTLTLPIVTGTITAWVETTTASSATPTPTGDARQNVFTVTALATAPTFAAPSGTATNGNTILIRIKDDGTARAISWNAIYRGGTDIALPSTTTISKTMYCNFVYNSSDTKWDLVGLTDGI